MNLNLLKFGLLFIFLASGNVFAQYEHWQETENLDVVLLKKDLAQAIRETENSPANDLPTLLRKLNLYHRAVNTPKIAAIVRQIADRSSAEKNSYNVSEGIKYYLKDEFFKDGETLRIFLQKIAFDGDIYEKFAALCIADQTNCDARGFDQWLAQKADETEAQGFDWTAIRIGWRNRLKMDNTEILNRFVENVRENPADLEVALKYLKYFRQSSEIAWLAENFASKQSYHYYEIGTKLAASVKNPSILSPEEKQEIGRVAVIFLQKSLSLPFDKTDIELIGSYRLRYASIPPKIGNYEKQLRFWTKTELAEVYKSIGEAQNAQPIIEELAELDKSDIIDTDINYLSGMVQMQSGARVIESKILREQATRQDSPEYWSERIAYYSGRKEPERVFDAYKQMLAVIPFDKTNEQSRENRLYYISRFADFSQDNFERYSDEYVALDDDGKRKLRLWNEAEKILTDEYKRDSADWQYSYKILEIIEDEDFDTLFEKLLPESGSLLIKAFAELPVEDGFSDLFCDYLDSESVMKIRKDEFVSRLEKIAQNANHKKALYFCETIIGNYLREDYAPRLLPILLRQVEKLEMKSKSTQTSDEESYELKSLKNKSVYLLFRTYLITGDMKSAEKLLMTKYLPSVSGALNSLMLKSMELGAYDEAIRYWKMQINIDRRRIESIEVLARNKTTNDALQELYRQMKSNKDALPISDIALQKLNSK